jgi:chromosome segregation ATPase
MKEEKFIQVINEAFQEQKDYFEKKFETVDNRLSTIDNRLSTVEEELSVVKKKVNDTYNLLDHFVGDYKRIDEEQVALGARVNQLEVRVQKVEVALP